MYRPRVELRTTVSRWLEEGSSSLGQLARLYAPFAAKAIARPLRIPRERDLFVVTVGGATIGGSGKTRVALACVRELAASSAQVVLVGHAYRARRLGGARVVSTGDHLDDVGDEALTCARALVDLPNVRVVVGPSRQAAIDLAASLRPRVDAVVIDGPLQLAPVRSSLALLAVDAHEPWGAGLVLPAGDLRAPRASLLANADHVVHVDATPHHARRSGTRDDVIALEALASMLRGRRVGLFTAIARPARLTRALERAGIAPDVTVRAPDHGPIDARLARKLDAAHADVWLATAKCAAHLASAAPRFGSPRGPELVILDGTLVLPTPIRRAIVQLSARA